MARTHGQSGRIYVDEYNLSGRANKIELTMEADLIEVTAFEDLGKAFIPSRPGWEAMVEAFADYTAAEIDAIIGASLTGTHAIGIYPAGVSAVGYEGIGIVKMQSRNSDNSDAAKLKFTMTGAGGTFLARSGGLLNNSVAVTGTGAQTGASTISAATGKTVVFTSRVIAVSGSGSITVALQESSDGSGDPYATAIAGTAQTAVGVVQSQVVAGATLGPFWRTNVTAFSGFSSVTLRTSIAIIG